jgi:hypothetical protein
LSCRCARWNHPIDVGAQERNAESL